MFKRSFLAPDRSGRAGVFWLWAPVLLVMAVIFLASSISDLSTLPGDVSDKTGHFAGYAVLALTVLRAMARARWAGVTARSAVLSWVVCLAYGASDEFHQRFVPGRTPALDDLGADAAGAATAILIVWCAAVVGRWSREV